MKKIILSIAILAVSSFVSCSDNDTDNTNSCEVCKNTEVSETKSSEAKSTVDTKDIELVEETPLDVEICDNGDGTVTITKSSEGKEVSSETKDIPEEGTINCSNYDDKKEIVKEETIKFVKLS